MKYPTDPKISEKLAYLVRELEGVHKRLNSVVASNRTVYGNGGVGGRLSGLSGKLGNLSASLDNSAATLRLAAEEFAKKEQEQKGKAATAAESAKNGVNITWVGTAVAAAVLGTTTVVKKSVGLNLSSVVKDAIDSVVKGSDEKAAISVTQSKYIDGQKYDAKEVRASIADLEKAQAEYKEKYGEESQTIKDEITRLKAYLPKNTGKINRSKPSETSTSVGEVRYVSAYKKGKQFDKNFWDSRYVDQGCAIASTSMALSSIGIDKSPKQIVADGNAEPTTGYMNRWKIEGTSLNEIQFPKENRQAINTTAELDSALKKYYENPEKYAPPITYIRIRSGDETFSHAVVVTGKNADGTYKVADPGGFAHFSALSVSDGTVGTNGEIRSSYLLSIKQYSKNN